jgi:hypothetical protein
MQRHHVQMLMVFVAALVGVLSLGTLWGSAIGIGAALILAPWGNPNLFRWLKRQLAMLVIGDENDGKLQAESEAAAWKPVAHTIHYAMDVEGLDVSASIARRDLTDQDIRQLVELDKDATRAGVHFDINENQKKQEAAVDTALRHRAARTIVLQKQV